MEVICLAIPLAEGTWVRVSRASRRLMAIEPTDLPETIKVCYGGDRQLDWVGVELAARAETQRIFYATRPGPGTVRRRFAVLRNLYEFALGLGLLASAQGMAIPALAGIWMLAKAGLRTRRRIPKLGRPENLAASPMVRSAHSGLARLGDLFDDETDERSAYLGASSLARSLALPEAEFLYEQLLAEPTGLHPGQVVYGDLYKQLSDGADWQEQLRELELAYDVERIASASVQPGLSADLNVYTIGGGTSGRSLAIEIAPLSPTGPERVAARALIRALGSGSPRPDAVAAAPRPAVISWGPRWLARGRWACAVSGPA